MRSRLMRQLDSDMVQNQQDVALRSELLADGVWHWHPNLNMTDIPMMDPRRQAHYTRATRHAGTCAHKGNTHADTRAHALTDTHAVNVHRNSDDALHNKRS